MPQSINVMFLAAEAEPFIKVGGLGDVAGSLPRYLRSLSSDNTDGTVLDVRLVLPLHPALRAGRHGLRPLLMFPLPHKDGDLRVQVSAANLDGMPVYFLDGEPISSSGSVYASDPALDGEKYTFFPLAALELPRHMDWKPNIVHANDWHTALACYALRQKRWEGEYGQVNSLLTIHNLDFMGPDVSETLDAYGLAPIQTGLPEWANKRPLPLGIWAADALVAVSPTYAREITTPKFGCGLEDYLSARRETLNGILNGIDTDSFNPALDPAIGANFGIPTLERRALNKSALQVRLGLASDASVPLFGVVSRLDRQKGTDVIAAALRKLHDERWQAVILGTGSPALEKTLKHLQEEFPERVRAELRYDAGLARQIYAGADIFLMPSRFEPCGLSQMIAMRYGCVPIVTAVGGLKDTIFDGETGFFIERATASRLAIAVRRAMKLFLEKDRWIALQKAGMSQDFSWALSAQQYFKLYQRTLSAVIPH